MNTDTRIVFLKNNHADLEQKLMRENKHRYPNDFVIANLKRKELRIKDELSLLYK